MTYSTWLKSLRDNPDNLGVETAMQLERVAAMVEREDETLGIDELIKRHEALESKQ